MLPPLLLLLFILLIILLPAFGLSLMVRPLMSWPSMVIMTVSLPGNYFLLYVTFMLIMTESALAHLRLKLMLKSVTLFPLLTNLVWRLIMSIRLNKIGNIPDYGPLDSTTYMHLNDSAFNAYVQRDAKTYPFDPRNFQGQLFAAFNKFTLGQGGNTVTFVGDGLGTLRDGKGDYFCAGMLLDNLFDSDRSDMDTLIGITSTIWTIAPPTQPQHAVYPMVIWTNTPLSTSKQGNVADVVKYAVLAPTYDYRYTTGFHYNLTTFDRSLTLAKGEFKHVYFAWFLGKADPYDLATVYNFKQTSISMTANSLIGNRPVFDPVMV